MTLQLAQPRLKTFRLNVSQYHQMSEAGIFSENDKVELINGEIIEMSPIGRRHAACVDRINRLFSNILGIKVIVRVQNPIILNNLSEPEPDIALLKPRADFYESGHPQPQDIFLLIEVTDHLSEYATLKAIGYTQNYLLMVILQEAFLLAVVGYVPGFACALVLYNVARDATLLPIFMSYDRAIMVIMLTILMCFISGMIAMRKLSSADPADIF
ncbi:Uma2 family endonuclease [Dolichospermum sp. ST_sed10]|nr:Uma2 family endonuclease [Dolichospermum sp. ST_sed10]